MAIGLGSLGRLRQVQTRSISAENFDGSPGGGGRATEGTGAACARDLGTGWKISPSVVVPPGETFDLAEIDGPGKITHIWLTAHSDAWRTAGAAGVLGRCRASRQWRFRTATSSAAAGVASPR